MSPRPSLKNPSMSFGPASARRPKRSRGSGSLLIRRFLESCSFAVIAVVFACSAVDWSLSLRALRALRSIVVVFASFARFAVDWSLSLRALRALRSIVVVFACLARFAVDRHPTAIVSTLFAKDVVNCVRARVAGPRRTDPDVLYCDP